MRNYRPRFTTTSIKATHQIIYSQDILMTGLADCMRNLEIQEYDDFKRKFRAIPIITDQLIRECYALLSLRAGKAGPKPKWYEWGEDVLHLALNLQRTIPTMRRENRLNDWEVIQSRLEECQRQCVELKTAILEIVPPAEEPAAEVNSEAVAEWIGLVTTAQMGGVILDPEGFKYRGSRK